MRDASVHEFGEGPRPLRPFLEQVVADVLDVPVQVFVPFDDGGFVLELEPGLEAWFPCDSALRPYSLVPTEGVGDDDEDLWL